jgi:hypothetical protein
LIHRYKILAPPLTARGMVTNMALEEFSDWCTEEINDKLQKKFLFGLFFIPRPV